MRLESLKQSCHYLFLLSAGWAFCSKTNKVRLKSSQTSTPIFSCSCGKVYDIKIQGSNHIILFCLAQVEHLTANLNRVRFKSSRESTHYLFCSALVVHLRAKYIRLRYESSQESNHFRFLLSSGRAKLNRVRFKSSQKSITYLILLS